MSFNLVGKLKSLIKWRKVRWSIASVFGFIFIGLNFGVSLVLPKTGLNYIVNSRPFGLDIAVEVTAFIIIFTILILYKTRLMDKYPISSVMILAGSISNFLERLYFGGVKDYLDVWIAHINLADLQIWIGLALLNHNVLLNMTDRPVVLRLEFQEDLHDVEVFFTILAEEGVHIVNRVDGSIGYGHSTFVVFVKIEKLMAFKVEQILKNLDIDFRKVRKLPKK